MLLWKWLLNKIDVHRLSGAPGGIDRSDAFHMVVKGFIEFVLQAQGWAAGLSIELW